MADFRIAILAGDGIGPEVMGESVRVLRALEPQMDTRFELVDCAAGAGEFLRSGDPLPERTMQACREADAILLGAMGLPNVRRTNGTEIAPQLDLREQLDLYAGVRPVYLYHPDHSPLKGREAGGIDFVIFRESTEGLFVSRKNSYEREAAQVTDSLRITRVGAERIVRAAFTHARTRKGRCTLIDKANVLPSMAFFRSIFDEIAKDFPDVEADRVYVDAAALYLVRNPERFDVMVMENLFGDILSDLAAGLVGGMGVAPSGDIGDHHAVFQPAHGSAPDIAGLGIANPLAMILSLAMLLDWLPGEGTTRGAAMIRAAVKRVLQDPANATPDIGGKLTTKELGETILRSLQ